MKTNRKNWTAMNYQPSRGFMMIEVLVSVVILAIGLLGIAGLQVVSLQNTNSANLRTQATLLAYEFADILRSNTIELNNNTFGTAANDGDEFSTATPGSSTASCITTTGCNTLQMAQTDRANWANNIAALLPGGTATTNRINNIYTVNITWADDRADLDDNNIANVTFSTSFQP